MFSWLKSWFTKAETALPVLVKVPIFLEQMKATLESSVIAAGESLLPIVVAAIKAAAINPNLSSSQKLQAVIYTVEQSVPGLAKSVVNAVVHTAYTTLAQDPGVPEIKNDTIPVASPVPVAPPALILPPSMVAATPVASIAPIAPAAPAAPTVSAAPTAPAVSVVPNSDAPAASA